MSSDPPPQRADYVIVGSGISGALIAFDLIKTLPKGTSILVIDARHAASGATGRNGGHIKPGRIAEFSYLKRKYGVKTAKAQVAFEKANYDDLTRFIVQEKLDKECALMLLRAVDACMNKKGLEHIQKSWKDMSEAGADMSGMEYHDAAFTTKEFRVPAALGSISYPAATLWPYKLAIALLKSACQLGVKLCTETPAHHIERDNDSGSWAVKTPKGTILTPNVIHATNGYASYLLPEITDKLVPCKGHAAAATPPESYFTSPLQTSFSFQWGDDYDYLIQRHHDTKPLIYGGRDLAGTGDAEFSAGDCNDATLNPHIAEALRKFPAQTFKDWPESTYNNSASDIQVWTGIMGFVADDFPYVGAVPGKPGQFICAGYTGRGMARAFLCTKALCQLLRGDAVDPRVPSVYFDLERRWRETKTLSDVLGVPRPSL